jgi:poly [ADP-ribose] polymerase
MFGKGVYFADMVSKSASYCAGSRESPTAVLLLCDVALGKTYEKIASEYEAAERSRAKGKHSTWGIGTHAARRTLHVAQLHVARCASCVAAPRASRHLVRRGIARRMLHVVVCCMVHAGRTMPHPDGTKALADGVRVPMGPAAPNAYLVENLDTLVAAGAGRKSELLYNEYIVYDVSQIRMKYVVVCDMDFHASA